MRDDFYLWIRQVGIIALLVVSAASSLAVCYSTPRSAVDALVTRSAISSEVSVGGYQVTRIGSDPVLGQKWAMVSRCGHPDWPVFAVPANGAIPFTAGSAIVGVRRIPLVRAGDIVRLWRQDGILRLEVYGVAEESGGFGSAIRVRFAHENTDDQSTPKRLSGIIRGRSDVEILP
jgi:hypothetical protein